MKRSVGIVVLVTGLFFTGLFSSGSAGAAPAPTLTRLRIVLTESAEWASFKLTEGRILAHHVTAQSHGSTVKRGSYSVVLTGSNPASATVDLVAWIHPYNSPVLMLAKSQEGTARLQVYQTNGTPFLLRDITNNRTDKEAIERRTVTHAELVGAGVPIPPRDPRRLVLARYYPWYDNWTTFNEPRYADRPSGAYRTDDAGEVAAMVAQAAGAGIDGFIVNWDGQGDHPRRFDLVKSAAEARSGFYVSPAISTTAFRNSNGSFNQNAIANNILATLQRSNSASFLRASGRPVVFVFNAFALGVDGWRNVVARVAASGQNPFYFGEPVSLKYGFDGSYVYNPNDYSIDQLGIRYARESRALRVQSLVDSSVPQRLWAATVSPGENNGVETPRDKEEQPRGSNGERYAATWDVALKSAPEWVLITSWNEWFESTHIQPSEDYGTTALDQTRALSARFKSQ